MTWLDYAGMAFLNALFLYLLWRVNRLDKQMIKVCAILEQMALLQAGITKMERKTIDGKTIRADTY